MIRKRTLISCIVSRKKMLEDIFGSLDPFLSVSLQVWLLRLRFVTVTAMSLQLVEGLNRSDPIPFFSNGMSEFFWTLNLITHRHSFHIRPWQPLSIRSQETIRLDQGGWREKERWRNSLNRQNRSRKSDWVWRIFYNLLLFRRESEQSEIFIQFSEIIVGRRTNWIIVWWPVKFVSTSQHWLKESLLWRMKNAYKYESYVNRNIEWRKILQYFFL